MLKLESRGLVAIILCVLMSNPPFLGAASTAPSARNVLGSIETHGAVRVGEILAPLQGTLFAGDRVATNNGGAIIQYREGARIVLASGSLANFAPAQVQLEKGLMTFRTVSGNGIVFAASTLRLESTSAKAAANVTLDNRQASISVTEGTVKVVDTTGAQLASLNAGEARLFEEASAVPGDPAAPAAAPAPAAPPSAAPPAGGEWGHSGWFIAALGLAAAGTAVGIAGLVQANDADNSADQANAQVAALNAQIASANAQIATLQARIGALNSNSATIAAIVADLAKQEAALAQAQSSLNAIEAQLAAGTISSSQAASQIAALQTVITTALNAINADIARANSCANTNSPATPTC